MPPPLVLPLNESDPFFTTRRRLLSDDKWTFFRVGTSSAGDEVRWNSLRFNIHKEEEIFRFVSLSRLSTHKPGRLRKIWRFTSQQSRMINNRIARFPRQFNNAQGYIINHCCRFHKSLKPITVIFCFPCQRSARSSCNCASPSQGFCPTRV